ncbi:hypothetical protein Rumeso_02987 [Rubellimicrobium mesophilum DSM 19309]|uniref:NmrA-like domain-containing protein n=1 Tax=Rubellimicrobium mesophilum DSM 19309 TaxID=442562 RepID=A0A017HLN8_9RHOB|nr:NAD(P)H-binding protein [Rubellimicrobium mesophilum]EYD75417.1 hypothetical protein Rumeso_02987 [Rubellimicrobium mesophilum DSM 19309]
MTDRRRILVFGAEGATGREVVRQAAAKGHPVRASEKEFKSPEAIPEGVEVVPADVLEDDLRPSCRAWMP